MTQRDEVGAVRFEDAYAVWYPQVTRSAWSICRDRAQAEELAQEAFVRAYRRWSRLTHGGYAQPWVHRVAMNLALTAVKRNAHGRALEATQVPAFAPATEAEGDWLVETLRQLPRRQREAVFLRVIADLPEEQVAQLMGCTPGAVKVHKKRGLTRLRELLTTSDEGGSDERALRAAHTARR